MYVENVRKSAFSCIDILSVQFYHSKRGAGKQVEKSPHRNSLIADW